MSVENNYITPELLLAPQVAQMLQIGINRVYELARSGQIRSIRIGNSIRFPRKSIMTWIEEAQE